MNPLISIRYECPSCGEENETEVDLTAGKKQTFTEDCTVCCRPNVISFTVENENIVDLDVQFEG
jgi:uncharacterized Zn finger protein